MKSLCNFTKVRLLVLVAAVVLCGMSAPTQAADKPNVLLILVDDLGYGDLSCYGATDLQSPNIDELVSRGLKFTNFYANCPVCSPTRAAILSGKYPDRVGVPGVIRTHADNSWGYLTPEARLLPSLLKPAGYHSAIIGKWHLGLEAPNRPNDRGFDHFKGYLGDMMDDYYNHRRHGINYMRENNQEIDPEGHATDLFTEWSCDYLKQQADSDQPFFLYLAYNAPHTPIQPPQDWLEKVQKRETGISEKRAKLVALIEHLDHGIGQVLECLEETGQAENTLVIFTSDNGGQLNVGANNGATRDGKQSMYQGGLKVPTAVVWPGKIEAGATTGFQALSMDFSSTILDVAGVEQPDDCDGRSILPTLLGEEQEPLRDLSFLPSPRRGDPLQRENDRSGHPRRLEAVAEQSVRTTGVVQPAAGSVGAEQSGEESPADLSRARCRASPGDPALRPDPVAEAGSNGNVVKIKRSVTPAHRRRE